MRSIRGLKTNLGLLLTGHVSQSARGERPRSLTTLLPQVTWAIGENVQQEDLQTKGIERSRHIKRYLGFQKLLSATRAFGFC